MSSCHRVIRILSFILAILCASASNGATLVGKVVGISDGDTVTVLTSDHSQVRVRLAGIDAPEHAQAFGNNAKREMSSLVFGRVVAVTYDKTDRYGRTIGKIQVDGQDAGLRMLEVGMAWWYRQYAFEQSPPDRRAYEAAERQARASGVGLWSQRESVAPWQYRHTASRWRPQKIARAAVLRPVPALKGESSA